MVTICILGLDQFVVGHYSKDHTKALASIFAVPEEAINFYAPNSMVFHAGAEQTSWNTIVVVRAPRQLEGCEDKAAEYILETLSQFSIHVELEFEYFEPGRHDDLPLTVVTREYPVPPGADCEPYYPINDAANSARYAQYRALAESEPGVVFGGRLGQYAYADMDDTVAAALALAATELRG